MPNIGRAPCPFSVPTKTDALAIPEDASAGRFISYYDTRCKGNRSFRRKAPLTRTFVREARPIVISELGKTSLVRCDSVEAGVRSETTRTSKDVQSSIGVDAEDADRASSGVNGVKKLAVITDRKIEIRATGRKRGEYSSVHRSKAAVGADPESGECARSGISGVEQLAIGSYDVPASCISKSRDTRADDGQSSS